jgi:hypothetical protein
MVAGERANNPLRVDVARKKLDSFVDKTLTAGKNIDGWIGILIGLKNDQTKSGQPCVTASIVLRDLDEERSYPRYDLLIEQWPILRATTADPARKTVVQGLDAQFQSLSVNGPVQVWGTVQTADGPSRPNSVTVTVSKIAPFVFGPERAEAVKHMASVLASLPKFEPINTAIAAQEFYYIDDDDMSVPLGLPKDFAKHIGMANKSAEYREAVLSFNRFTPTILGPTLADDLARTQSRIQNARFLNEKKALEDARVMAQKLNKALLDADRQQKDFNVIQRYLRDHAEWKPAYTYSELLPEVRAETDKDKYAFTPFRVQDRKNRPAATPHPDSKTPAKPKKIS